MDNFDYYESLKRSLEEAVAFANGDSSKCRIVTVEPQCPKASVKYRQAQSKTMNKAKA